MSVCWGAICEFCEVIGINKLTDLEQLTNASPLQMMQFLWICLWYGARQEGMSEPALKPEELMHQVDHQAMIDFLQLTSRRMSCGSSEAASDDKKKET